MNKCSIEICDRIKKSGSHKYCQYHYTKWRLYRRRGFSPEQYELVMYTDHCEVCNEPISTPIIDHDHSHCGVKEWCILCFRGVVCTKCNQLLSNFDRPGVLNAAHKYLKLYEERKPKAKFYQEYKRPVTRDHVGRFLPESSDSH